MRTKVLNKLNAASRKGPKDVLSQFAWVDRWDPQDSAFTPELISLHGTAVYDALTETERRELGFREAVNFFSLNIHGEKSLVAGLSERLYREPTPELVEYLHHFLSEENQHMSVFGSFCLRYAGKIYPNRKLALPRPYAEGEEEFLFFAKVLVFEEIVDVYNDTMAEDPSLADLVRQIHRYHHADETRHLAFGRLYVRELFEMWAPRWEPEVLDRVRDELLRFYQMAWREYFNPDVYRETGIEFTARELAEWRNAPAARERRWRLSRRVVELFLDLGVELEAQAA